MGRIVFLNCFPREYVTGGVKTTYRHASLLHQAGFDACVMQPTGAPSWLDQETAALVHKKVMLRDDDVLVFPETLQGWYADTLKRPMGCSKVIFCQNPYYFISYPIAFEGLRDLGVRQIIVPGHRTARMLQTIMGWDNAPIAPPVVDKRFFTPRAKKMQILCAGWKWPQQDNVPAYPSVIQKILCAKYPYFADVPWIKLEGKTEQETAKLMGESAICLSLARLESVGLTALEAMAAGCLMVGFHGGCDQDYATAQNGFWHSPEDLEGVVDSLAIALSSLTGDNAFSSKMLAQGHITAQAFGAEPVRARLTQIYGTLLEEAASH